jgi:hypothetical protein
VEPVLDEGAATGSRHSLDLAAWKTFGMTMGTNNDDGSDKKIADVGATSIEAKAKPATTRRKSASCSNYNT